MNRSNCKRCVWKIELQRGHHIGGGTIYERAEQGRHQLLAGLFLPYFPQWSDLSLDRPWGFAKGDGFLCRKWANTFFSFSTIFFSFFFFSGPNIRDGVGGYNQSVCKSVRWLALNQKPWFMWGFSLRLHSWISMKSRHMPCSQSVASFRWSVAWSVAWISSD